MPVFKGTEVRVILLGKMDGCKWCEVMNSQTGGDTIEMYKWDGKQREH